LGWWQRVRQQPLFDLSDMPQGKEQPRGKHSRIWWSLGHMTGQTAKTGKGRGVELLEKEVNPQKPRPFPFVDFFPHTEFG